MNAFADLAAAAFADDPLLALLFPEERWTALRDWFTVVHDSLGGCRHAQLRAGPDSIVVWTTRRCRPCLDDLTGHLMDVVARRSGPSAPELLGRLADGTAELSDGCWVLHWLAVAPAARGAGLATAAVQDLAARATAAGAAVYTETASPRATRLYLRAGFRPVGAEALVGAPGVTYSRLLRPPAPLLPSASDPDTQEGEGG